MTSEDTSEKPKIATQCAKCNRVVWTTDVDATGYCVFCAPALSIPLPPFSGEGDDSYTEKATDKSPRKKRRA